MRSRHRSVGQVARIGLSQTGPLLPEGSDDVYRDLRQFWDEMDGPALRAAAEKEAVAINVALRHFTFVPCRTVRRYVPYGGGYRTIEHKCVAHIVFCTSRTFAAPNIGPRRTG